MVGDPAKPTWTEPLVRVVMRGHFDAAGDQVRIEEATVQSSGLAGTAAGRVDRLSTMRPRTHRAIEYDLALGTASPQPARQRRQGGGPRPSALPNRGLAEFHKPRATWARRPREMSPLGQLKGELDLGWQSLQAFGCQIGPSDLKLHTGDGWIRIQPIDTTLNQGKLKLEPYIRLEPGPTALAFGKATGIEKARITPALCSALLGYASPVFGGVHEADGEVSLAIEGGQVPLDDPTKADLWGRFTVHHVKVTPGPLLQELAILLKSPPSLNLPKEHVVPFRLVNGRIYHQNLELPIGEFTIRSTGSVGLDGSLALITKCRFHPNGSARTNSRNRADDQVAARRDHFQSADRRKGLAGDGPEREGRRGRIAAPRTGEEFAKVAPAQIICLARIEKPLCSRRLKSTRGTSHDGARGGNLDEFGNAAGMVPVAAAAFLS